MHSYMSQWQTLDFSIAQILQAAASSTTGLEFYPPGKACRGAVNLKYADLLSQAQIGAHILSGIPSIEQETIFLLHFDNHFENIKWFWAVTLAGYLPCISTPFATDLASRERHILHLKSLLGKVVALVNERTATEFLDKDVIQMISVDSFTIAMGIQETSVRNRRSDDLAALMLTSGSTGDAKAVCLTHLQILQACSSKSQHCGSNDRDTFLNWIGLDHVANLLEIHLQAMMLGAKQVHVQANDLLVDPLLYMSIIHEQRISVTFAPNFFLSHLYEKALAADPFLENPNGLDLSCLRSLHSGGEATVVETAVNITKLFSQYGNTSEFLRPGYGLSETCAGITWGSGCPSKDLKFGRNFTSVGTPITNCRLRIMTELDVEAHAGELGELQVSGPMVFKQYYRNQRATEEAFTPDGWFITGDRALIDPSGDLVITGRTKEILNINGVKWFSHQIELAIEGMQIRGVLTSFTAVFPHRPLAASTETYCIAYLPTFDSDDTQMRIETHESICRSASGVTGSQPFKVLPLPSAMFHKSGLGKLSRARIRKNFEAGGYDDIVRHNDELIRRYRMITRKAPTSKTEEVVLQVIGRKLRHNPEEISVTASLFQLGFTSLDFFALAQNLQMELNLSEPLDIADILRQPTTGGIAKALDPTADANALYDPVVRLQSEGNKTPLWIVHPASGNVLAFVPLARYFANRPIYGLRPTGVKRGERMPASLGEMAATYYRGIKRTQPQGPYAVAGYSLGSSIAFEVAKILEASGDEVRFVGALDSPPHIASLVGSLTWSAGLVMVSFFYELISERYSNEVIPRLWHEKADKALDFIIDNAEPARLRELNLDRAALSHVADITANFSKCCGPYEPQGSIGCMDVFIVDPLQSVTSNRHSWMEEYLVHWKDFVRNDNVEFHQCEGHHANMLNAKHAQSFHKKLKAVLNKRGL